jgi:hypothetical protein
MTIGNSVLHKSSCSFRVPQMAQKSIYFFIISMYMHSVHAVLNSGVKMASVKNEAVASLKGSEAINLERSLENIKCLLFFRDLNRQLRKDWS